VNEEQLALEGMPEPLELPERDPVIDEDWVQDLLDNPDAPVEELLTAFQISGIDPRLRDATLLHPRLASVDLATAISGWPESTRDRAVSVTDNRPLLEKWADSPIPFERAVVAMNPRCPADLASALASDPEPAVRANAVCCPQLPRPERAGIANRDPNPDVRDFTRWLMTTIRGRDILEGHRYAQAPGESDGVVARVVTYGLDRALCGPS
jgi:hypothetical protein